MTALPSARRVLIVDDERDIRTTLHAVFGSAGYECRMAGDGREAARIFAVADAFDALTFDRPYSTAITMAAARARIREAAGTHFDPDVVATFLTVPLEVFEEARARSRSRPSA